MRNREFETPYVEPPKCSYCGGELRRRFRRWACTGCRRQFFDEGRIYQPPRHHRRRELR